VEWIVTEKPVGVQVGKGKQGSLYKAGHFLSPPFLILDSSSLPLDPSGAFGACYRFCSFFPFGVLP
jgi:hypothetical protein